MKKVILALFLLYFFYDFELMPMQEETVDSLILSMKSLSLSPKKVTIYKVISERPRSNKIIILGFATDGTKIFASRSISKGYDTFICSCSTVVCSGACDSAHIKIDNPEHVFQRLLEIQQELSKVHQ